jgi:hypothetical protein
LSDEIDPVIVEGLKNSVKLRGPYEKVVLSADGKLVDGHQRKAADPDWPEEINPNLKTEEDIILFEIDKNWHRTNKSDAWKRKRIEKLANLGNNVDQVVHKTGIPQRTVYRYYPEGLKDKIKSDAGKASGEASSVATVATISQDTLDRMREEAYSEVKECANCHLGFRLDQLKNVESKDYCPRCAPLIHVQHQNENKAQKPTRPTQVESYTDKVARMHNGVSRMDEVQHEKAKENSELRDLGWIVEAQKEYVVVVCKSDLTLSRTRGGVPQEVAVFWDGQDAHPDPDRDEANRAWAQEEQQRRLGVHMEVFARVYKAYSPALADKLWSELMEFVKELDKWDEKPAVQEDSE